MKTIKKAVAAVTSLLMVASFSVTSVFAADTQKSNIRFKDISENDWFCDDVKYAYDNNILKGVSEDMFEPGGNLSRAMAATMLYRLDGEPETPHNINYFEDTNEGDWFYYAVKWARRSRIIYGYSNTVYAPDDDITRADFAVMLMRYASYKNLSLTEDKNNKSSFTDRNDIPYYSALAVDILNSSGVIKGKTEKTFAPTDKITRAEAAAMIHRFNDNSLKNQSTILSEYGFEIKNVDVYYHVHQLLAAYSDDLSNTMDDIAIPYVLISLNKLQDNAEIPECDISVEITDSSDSKSTTVSIKKDTDAPKFKGYIDLGAIPNISNNRIYKASVDITAGDKTETLVYYINPVEVG